MAATLAAKPVTGGVQRASVLKRAHLFHSLGWSATSLPKFVESVETVAIIALVSVEVVASKLCNLYAPEKPGISFGGSRAFTEPESEMGVDVPDIHGWLLRIKVMPSYMTFSFGATAP
jgi:hypothetical protein